MLISAVVAGLAALLVFFLWYPGIYRRLAGGQELFFLLTCVDVVLGPLLTFAVFNVTKRMRHLRRDLVTIGLIQFAALGYGLHAVFVVRPVALVLEGNRFRVVSAKDVELSELPEAHPEYRTLPLTGPWVLGTRAAKSAAESGDSIVKALGGTDVGQRPSFWEPFDESRALARSRPLELLLSRQPYEESAGLRGMVSQMKVDPSSAKFLPVICRGDWSAVLDVAGRPVGFLPVSGFF